MDERKGERERERERARANVEASICGIAPRNNSQALPFAPIVIEEITIAKTPNGSIRFGSFFDAANRILVDINIYALISAFSILFYMISQ